MLAGMNTKTLLIFDAQPYDIDSFNRANNAGSYGITLQTISDRLSSATIEAAQGHTAISVFVHDLLDRATIERLYQYGVRLIALRCSGCEHIDLNAARGKIAVVHVPAYSPHAVAEHTVGLMLCLIRKLDRAIARTRQHNFSIVGLTGSELYGKTIGIIGTGAIGSVMATIMHGFGMRVIAYEPDQKQQNATEAHYTSLEYLLSESDIISLHCTLTEQNYHMINSSTIATIKRGAYIINSARGGLIDSSALLAALTAGHLAGAALDVYEYEHAYFYRDHTNDTMGDTTLAQLLQLPQVIISSHQAFFTHQALLTIADTTLRNVQALYAHQPLSNQLT